MGWVNAKVIHTDLERGVRTEFWMPEVAPPAFAAHLYPADTVVDVHAVIDFTLPCNFVMRFQVWSPGTAKVGKERGQLLLDSWTSQAVTPRDEDWCVITIRGD